MLDDHAAIGWAAVELYQSTGEERYLEDAWTHAEIIRARFADADGTLYTVMAETADVIVRQKQGYDSAYPCGNSMAAWCMTSLAAITNDSGMRAAAEHCVRSWRRAIATHGPGFCMLLSAWDVLLHGSQEIVYHGSSEDAFLADAKGRFGAAFLPDAVFVHPNAQRLQAAAYPTNVAPSPAILWCSRQVCLRPLTSMRDVEEHLQHLGMGHTP
jgi:uncharacterized protein YyaL (SSP411 family)